MLLKILFFSHYTRVLCHYKLCRADHAHLTYIMLPPQLVTLTVVSLTEIIALPPNVICINCYEFERPMNSSGHFVALSCY
jgi:hypothetical protein